ncbi:MAG: LytTR family transcriptional regulator [Bacteroidota bacterium]|nr:LytTR family transcriptional regulator [Bacteroidota bacterium]
MPQLFKILKPAIPDHYPDQAIRLLGSLLIAHFIEMLGRSESSLNLLLQKQYYINVLSGFVIAFITWQLIARITSYLDENYDWYYQTTTRLLWQLLLGVFLPSIIVFFLAYLQFQFIFRFNIFATEWLLFEYPVCIVCLIAINGYYVGFYFYNRWLQAEKKLAQFSNYAVASDKLPQHSERVNLPIETKSQILIANRGNKSIPIPVTEIAYSYITDQNCFLKTFNAEEFLINQSLDDLAESLPADLFFRANRQLLVNLKSCAAFSPIENGKLSLQLQPASNVPAVVSQKKAKSFKEWLANR